MDDQPTYSKTQLNHLSGKILEAAFRVHSKLGPGLLEKAYEGCLAYELGKMGINASPQVVLPVHYDGLEIDQGYRVDMVVEKCILVELKSVERITPLHEAQLLTYLRLGGFNLGLLINFNVRKLSSGIKRLVQGCLFSP